MASTSVSIQTRVRRYRLLVLAVALGYVGYRLPAAMDAALWWLAGLLFRLVRVDYRMSACGRWRDSGIRLTAEWAD